MLQSKILSKYKEIRHYFLNSKESIEIKGFNNLTGRVSCQQIHHAVVKKIGNKKFYRGADGLIADKKSILEIRTADCLPVLLYASDKNIIAAIHVGWRGLVRGIINNSCCKLYEMGIDRKNLKVAIGPHIGVCCYQAGKELIEKISKITAGGQKFYKKFSSGYYLDLAQIVSFQFKNSGIPAVNIEDVNICTSCNPDFNSYRRDKTEKRNLSVLQLI